MRPSYRIAGIVFVLMVLGGCGTKQPEDDVATAGQGGNRATLAAGDSAEQTRRWADCMRSAGVPMAQNADGQPVVDKDSTRIEKIDAAYAACRSLVPVVDETVRPPTAEELDRLRRHAACVREHGLTDYPDPDPVTGAANADDVLAQRPKSDLQVMSALEACRSTLSSTPGIAGG
jgi:hypothetical protein